MRTLVFGLLLVACVAAFVEIERSLARTPPFRAPSLAPFPTLESVRQDALLSEAYDQNWLRPGCGTGRQAQESAHSRFTKAVERRPHLLSALLADSSKEVRATAVLHIGYSRAFGFEAELSQALIEDSDARVREYAAAALGRTNAGAEALRSALSDNSVDVRFMALTALLACSEKVERSTQRRIEDDADRHAVSALSTLRDR